MQKGIRIVAGIKWKKLHPKPTEVLVTMGLRASCRPAHLSYHPAACRDIDNKKNAREKREFFSVRNNRNSYLYNKPKKKKEKN